MRNTLHSSQYQDTHSGLPGSKCNIEATTSCLIESAQTGATTFPGLEVACSGLCSMRCPHPYFHRPPDILQNEWKKLQDQLEQLRTLSDNWNGLGSEAPNGLALWNAQTIFDVLHEVGMVPYQIAASAEEGVSFSFVKDEKYALIECYNDGDILVAFSDSNGKRSIWMIDNTNKEIKDALERIGIYVYE